MAGRCLFALLVVGCLVLVGGPGSAAAHAPDCHHHRSRSIGSPGIGGSDRTRWGHCHVVRAVLRGLAAYRHRNPRAPLVAVGDIGLRHGGEIDGHSTHENGRQIDLYFPRLDRKHREPHTIAQVDMRLSRELVRAILDAGAQRVLVGPHIRIRPSADVAYWPNHDDHLHAMF
jgi:Penicillin-insensitive murein endopeptidase